MRLPLLFAVLLTLTLGACGAAVVDTGPPAYDQATVEVDGEGAVAAVGVAIPGDPKAGLPADAPLPFSASLEDDIGETIHATFVPPDSPPATPEVVRRE